MSATMCGFLMEDLEARAMVSAPETHKPTLWKRYLDDILENIKMLEEQHIQAALKTCQYPQWAIEKGKKSGQKKRNRTEEGKETNRPNREQWGGDTAVYMALAFEDHWPNYCNHWAD